MEVINTNAWSGEVDPANGPNSSIGLYGFRDLTFDYYQVLRQKERPRWCKVVWFVILTGLLLFTGYVTYLLVVDYLSNGSFDSYDTIAGTDAVLLPAITLCSLNPINYTRIRQEVPTKVIHEMEHMMTTINKAKDIKSL